MHVQRFQDSNERRDRQLVPQVIYFVNKCEAMFYSLLESSSYLKLLVWSQQLLTLKPARFRSNVGKLTLSDSLVLIRYAQAGADPGFFLGGGALVSCSTSTPINHIVFFCRIPVVLENRRSPEGGGGGGAHPLHPPPRSALARKISKAVIFKESDTGNQKCVR